MTTHDPLTNALNAWLDADPGGMSTSAGDASTDPDLAQLRSSIRHFNGLANQGDLYAANRASIPSTWEDLMQTHQIANTATVSTTSTLAGRVAELVSARLEPLPGSTTSPPKSGRSQPVPRWQQVSNIVLAAVLVLAIGAGLWRINGGFGPGSGNDDPDDIPFGGAAQSDGTPDPVKNVDPGTFPKAEDCTITPLTIDEVIAYVIDPYSTDSSGTPVENTTSADVPEPDDPADGASSSSVGSKSKDEASSTFHANYPSQEDLDAIAVSNHQLISCMLADQWFQVWALEAPHIVQRQVLQFMPSTLTSEETARQLLQNLQVNGPSPTTGPFDTATGTFPPPSSVSLGGANGNMVIDTNRYNAWQPGEGAVYVGYATYSESGKRLRKTSSIFIGSDFDTFEPIPGRAYRLENQCVYMTYSWSTARNLWQLESPPACG